MRRAGAIFWLVFLVAVSAAAELREVSSLDEVLQAFHPASRLRVVNVWATWCAPCVAELGALQSIADRSAPTVEVIGLSLDDAIPGDRPQTRRKVEQFLRRHHIRYTNLYFTGRTAGLADRLRFDGSIPITIVFDAAGSEVARNEGVLDAKRFGRTLEQLSAKRGRSINSK